MITFFPIGRLGNLMFQTAATIGYARKFGYEWGVLKDTREVPQFRQFFNVPRASGWIKDYKEHPNAWCHLHNCHLDVCHFDYHPFIDRGDDVRLFGFYQSLEYFREVQEEVKSVFKLDFIPGYEDYCSIHVRRGDYVRYAGSFPPITVDYVEKAMQKIRTGKYMVFSDDIQWCKENLAHLDNSMQKFEYSEGRDEKGDLSLMASCGHHIIANSSFSWWGGYLGHNPDKVIVSPAQSGFNWFGPTAGVKDPKTLIPKEWIQIAFR